MAERRKEDRLMKEMKEDIKKVLSYQEKLDTAIFGDEKINHIGLICQTKINTDNIRNLKSDKKAFILFITALSVICAFLKDYILTILGKGG